MDRDKRVVTECRVSFVHDGRRHEGVSEDLGRGGAFVRSGHFVARGEVLELEVELPGNERAVVAARVAHVLSPEAARAMGRAPGMGLRLEGAVPQALDRFVERRLGKEAPEPAVPSDASVFVACASLAKLERLRRALLAAGHHVRCSTDVEEAYEECFDQPPTLIVADGEIAGHDRWALLRALASKRSLAHVPVVLVGEAGSHVGRLDAYRRGVRDFIEEPFTDEEICLRLRRVLDAVAPRQVSLSGVLGDLSLPVLLGLLEFERKSGILRVLCEDAAAKLFVSGGQVFRVEGGAEGNARDRVLAVLSWTSGSFEFSAQPVDGDDEVGLPTQHLLLEHARLADEATRGDEDEGLAS